MTIKCPDCGKLFDASDEAGLRRHRVAAHQTVRRDKCLKCNGTGKVFGIWCDKCSGSGIDRGSGYISW